MKKIFILGAGLLAMVGLVYFSGNQSNRENVSVEEGDLTTTLGEVEAEPVSGKGSLVSLMEQNKNLECSIDYVPEGQSEAVTGTYFTSSGMMRGDFIVPGMQEGVVSSMILRDSTLYSWSVIEGDAYGMKIDLAMFENTTSSESRPEVHESVPLEAEVSYRCTPWKQVDMSIFSIPSDVLFKDFAEVTAPGMEFGTIYEESSLPTTSPCDLCLQVAPGEGQDECKARFSCQ